MYVTRINTTKTNDPAAASAAARCSSESGCCRCEVRRYPGPSLHYTASPHVQLILFCLPPQQCIERSGAVWQINLIKKENLLAIDHLGSQSVTSEVRIKCCIDLVFMLHSPPSHKCTKKMRTWNYLVLSGQNILSRWHKVETQWFIETLRDPRGSNAHLHKKIQCCTNSRR